MVTLLELKTHNIVMLMPFLIIIGCIILLWIDNKLNKRVPSQFLTGVMCRVIAYPILIFSPLLFFISLGNDALYFYMTGLTYFYWMAITAGFVIAGLYWVEYAFREFIGIELYIDGYKVKWGKYFK